MMIHHILLILGSFVGSFIAGAAAYWHGYRTGKRAAERARIPSFTCFRCDDGFTPLYCLNCAAHMLKK